MTINLLTIDDLNTIKNQIIVEIQQIFPIKGKKYLKSAELRELLGGISDSKLQSIRVNGKLPAIKLDGMWLYDYDDVIGFLEKNKINSKGV